MPKKSDTAAEAAIEADAIEMSVAVRSSDAAFGEVRLSDDDGKCSMVLRLSKTVARKAARGTRYVLSLKPDPAETAENMVTVEIPAEDTGGLPGSAKEVKKDAEG